MMIVTTMMVVSAVGCLAVGLGAGIAFERHRLRTRPDLAARLLDDAPEVAVPAQRTSAPAAARQARRRAAAG